MGLILDTNALSAFADGDTSVRRELIRSSEIVLPSIVLGEFRFGIYQSKHRNDYEQWLNEVIFFARLLIVDAETSAHYAEIRLQLKKAGSPIPSNDVWIAALCRQHNFPILSRDKHFDRVEGIVRCGW
jgi:tRNA(fMet)-specific endonuclease VapC